MKLITIISGLAILSLCVSCSKSGDPTNTTNNTNSSNGIGSTAAVTITDFSPKSAQPGTTITITGTGFGNDVKAIKAAIGNLPYDYPISVTPTSMTIVSGDVSGKISVFLKDTKYYSVGDFTAQLKPLRIVNLNGSAGQINSTQLGRMVYMQTEGLGKDTSQVTISFAGGPPQKITYVSPSFLSVGTTVPRTAQAGKVTLTAGNRTATSDMDLNFDMSIRDFTPATIAIGDTLKVTGVAFTNKDDMSIDFNTANSTIVRPIKVTPTELYIIVPATAKTGQFQLSAKLGTIFDYSPTKLTVTPHR